MPVKIKETAILVLLCMGWWNFPLTLSACTSLTNSGKYIHTIKLLQRSALLHFYWGSSQIVIQDLVYMCVLFQGREAEVIGYLSCLRWRVLSAHDGCTCLRYLFSKEIQFLPLVQVTSVITA